MNCDNLTPSEAVDLYYSSLPIDFEKRRLEIRRGTFFVKDYRSDVSSSYVKGQFRGYLAGSGWVIYIGEETKIYWSITQFLKRGGYSDWEKFSRTIDWDNSFGAGPIFDITDLICKDADTQFINWLNENPLEVKR